MSSAEESLITDKGSQEPPRKAKRPWWKWHLVTLAVMLFVLMWIRELLNLPPGSTWILVTTVLGAWWITPAALAGELPPPFPPTVEVPDRPQSVRTAGHAPTGRLGNRRYGRFCRAFARCHFVVGILWALFGLWWMAAYWRYGVLQMLVVVVLYGLAPSALIIAGGVAMWTLGDLSETTHQIAARQHRPVRSRGKVSSSRTTGRVDPNG